MPELLLGPVRSRSRSIPGNRNTRRKRTGYLSGKLSAEAENHGVAVIAVIREAVGPDFEILIDCHGRFDAPTAIRLAKALEPYKLFWFEEPVPVESTHALRQVRQNVSVPNHYRVETHRAKLSAYDVFIDHQLDIKGDKIFLSDRPGLGIELDRDYMRGHALEGYTG